MQLHPVTFWNLLLTEFDRKCRGYRRQQAEAWRRTRLLVTLLVNIHRDPKTPAVSPEELLPLLGDLVSPSRTPDSAADIEALWKALDERDALLIP